MFRREPSSGSSNEPRYHRFRLEHLKSGAAGLALCFLFVAQSAHVAEGLETPKTQGPEAVQAAAAATPPVPNLSGAEMAYPLNPMVDGNAKPLGNPFPNANFQQASFNTGTPPANADLQSAPLNSVGIPNGDFGTGTFKNWTKTGSTLTIANGNAAHGSFAKFGSGSDTLDSAAVTIPNTAQELVYDINYINASSYSGLKVYVLTGANYGQATLLLDDARYMIGAWDTSFINVTAYRGKSVKFRFVASWTPVGLDNVKVQQVFPGYDITGSPVRRVGGTGNAFAEINGSLTTSAFTVDAAAQYLTFKARTAGGTAAWELWIAEGPTFSFTEVNSGGSPDTWQTIRYDLRSYIGKQIKVRLNVWFGGTQIDDIGLTRVEVPQWSIADNAVLADDGAGNLYAQYHGSGLTSSPITIPAGSQNLLVKARTDPNSGVYQNVGLKVTILYGTNFSQSASAGGATTSNTWDTYRVGVGNYAGQTVKILIWSGSGTLNVDDVGPFEQVLPGWVNTSEAIQAGQDSHGTYVRGVYTGTSLRSSWVDLGLVSSSHSFTIGYMIAVCQACIYQVAWTNDSGGSWIVLSDSGPQGVYKQGRIGIHNFMGSRGYFSVALINGSGARLYSLGDNVARQQLSEPFSRKVGEGIDTTTGAIQFEDNDLSIPGSTPITFTRYYNAHSDYVGSMGYRWTNSFDTRIEFQGSSAALVFGSGREEFFSEYYGTYTAVDPRVHATLKKETDGTFTYTSKDSVRYRFSSIGALNSITDANGNALTLARDAQDRLTSVTGMGGISIQLGYDAQGRLASVADPTGATRTYGYNANDDLVSVTDAAGGVRRYAYVGHLLDTVTDENGKLVVDNDYDDYSRVTKQTDALNKSITVAYDTPGKGATRVTDPLGKQATFYFDKSQRTMFAVDGSDRVINYIYDSNGNLDKIVDPAGNQWDFAFDASGDLTSTADPLGNPSTISYNPQHLPTTVVDARGNTTSYTYDARGNVTSVTDPLGHVKSSTWDASGNLLTETNALGRTTSYTYDAKGNQLTKTDPAGKTWTYTYDGANRLKSETDPLGNVTRRGYDALGRLISLKDPLERETNYEYDAVGHLLRSIDPMGHQTTWDYEARGLVEAKIDPAGNRISFTYDADRRMTGMTDPFGHTTSYGYDGAGRLTSETDALSRVTSYSYDAAGRVASTTDPLGRVTSYVYDAAGHLTQLTAPNGASVVQAYDPNGNLASTTNQLGVTTARVFDAANRMTGVTDPLGRTTTYAYDEADQTTSITDPLGDATSYTYDVAGRRRTTTSPTGGVITNDFDAAGRLLSVTDPTSRVTQYVTDAAGQIIGITDPAGRTTQFAYNGDGQLVSITRPSGAITSYSYNNRGLQTSVTDPLLRQTAFGYDAAGRRTSETDPLGRITNYGFDAADQLTTITDAIGGVVTLGYDAAAQLTTVKDPRLNTWTYGYDLLGNRKTLTDPLGRTTTWGYDAAGQLTSRADPRGIAVSYAYDANGSPTSVTYPGGSTGYGYDGANRRTSMTDATGTTTFAYDNAGRLSSAASGVGAIAYGYDAAGRRTNMTLPGNKQVTYAYNSAGRLATLTDPNGASTTFGYDVDGRRTSIARPNGVNSTYTFDAASQISSVAHTKGAATLQSFTYTYDGAGNRKSVTTSSGTDSFTFDALNRLTAESYVGGPNISYTYDGSGNRKTAVRNGTTTNYTYDNAGQLTKIGTKSLTYDADGNLIAYNGNTYGWDWNSRLTSATVGGHAATYAYDGDDVRVRSTVDGATKNLLVDRAGELPTVVSDGSTSYLHAGELISQVGASTTYPLTDALGSIRGMTNSAGSLTGSANYEAFGAVRGTSTTSSMFGFAGEPSDATGLIYLRARYLDVGTGRMLSPDSVFPNAPGTPGYNLYAYAANNPTTWTDPTGHVVELYFVYLFIFAVLALGLTAFWFIACVLDDVCFRSWQEHQELEQQYGSSGTENQCATIVLDAPNNCPPLPQAGSQDGRLTDVIDRMGDNARALIGENMQDRVIPAAGTYEANFFTPNISRDAHIEEEALLALDYAWLSGHMAADHVIVDIGPAVRNALGQVNESYPRATSDYYKMEVCTVTYPTYDSYTEAPWPGGGWLGPEVKPTLADCADAVAPDWS